MAAWLLAATNPTAKIIVLDPKDEFTKKDLFPDSWKRHYPDMIEWTPLSKLGKVAVDPKAMEFRAGGETFKADVANVIPTQKAGAVAEGAGPTDNGWCPMAPATMQSRIDENIHVLGTPRLPAQCRNQPLRRIVRRRAPSKRFSAH
jgi:sulfide dehydrogenase [flavocytochrome c] flavoprotein chain